MSSTSRIELDQYLPHPPGRVWRALTDPELMAAWLMPNDFEPRRGHRFTLDTGAWGLTDCEVLAIDTERLLQVSWRNPPLDTVVTWRLVPEGRGTRLFLVHDGFDPDDPAQQAALRGMGGGWRSGIMTALQTCLSSIEAAGH